jgi:hypothetical protein
VAEFADRGGNYMDRFLDWLESTTPEERLAETQAAGRRASEEGQAEDWAGSGFERPADDGEPVCYRSAIGVMVHGPGCCCESAP